MQVHESMLLKACYTHTCGSSLSLSCVTLNAVHACGYCTGRILYGNLLHEDGLYMTILSVLQALWLLASTCLAALWCLLRTRDH